MQITIDTELQAIIVPDSYFMQVDILNDIIASAEGNRLDYTAYIKTCFEKAYATQIVKQSDVAKLRRRMKANKVKSKVGQKPAANKPAQTAEGEQKCISP